MDSDDSAGDVSDAQSDSEVIPASLEVQCTGGPDSSGLIPRGRPLYNRLEHQEGDDDDNNTDLSAKCDKEARFAGVIKDPKKRRNRLNRLNQQLERLMAKINKDTGACGIAFIAPIVSKSTPSDRMYTITSPDVDRVGLFADKNLRAELVRALQRIRRSYRPSTKHGRARVFTHNDDPDHSTIVNVDIEMLEVIRRVGSHAESIIRRVRKNDPGITGESCAKKDGHT